MKIILLSSIITLSFALLPAADAGFLKKKEKVTKVVECPIAVVEGVYVSDDCKYNTRICPVAVAQNSLLHPSCQGLTKRCPPTASTIPPGCSRVTNLQKTPSSTSDGDNVIDLANADWGCTTDENGIGTCQTQEQCTEENNVKRCTQCTQTISVQASEDDESNSDDSDNDDGDGNGNGNGNNRGTTQ